MKRLGIPLKGHQEGDTASSEPVAVGAAIARR
jgi:hypothetical protein